MFWLTNLNAFLGDIGTRIAKIGRVNKCWAERWHVGGANVAGKWKIIAFHIIKLPGSQFLLFCASTFYSFDNNTRNVIGEVRTYCFNNLIAH